MNCAHAFSSRSTKLVPPPTLLSFLTFLVTDFTTKVVSSGMHSLTLQQSAIDLLLRHTHVLVHANIHKHKHRHAYILAHSCHVCLVPCLCDVYVSPTSLQFSLYLFVHLLIVFLQCGTYLSIIYQLLSKY